MCVIYMVETHDQVLELWRTKKLQSLHILHLDFHCDMRGLLIDRNAQLAYRIWDMKQGSDEGNFLTHAILESRVRAIRWVHGEPGGRQYDVGTVKYESDLTALPNRLTLMLRGIQGIPVSYQELLFSDWSGLDEGELLDIDWDFFACTAYAEDTIIDRVKEFFDREFHFIPKQAYVCYSPDYSHPSRDLCQGFVADLAKIFNAEVSYIHPGPDKLAPEPFYKKHLPLPVFRIVRRFYYKTSLGLRRRGIY